MHTSTIISMPEGQNFRYQKQQETQSALEQLCRAVHAEVQEVRCAVSCRTAHREALLRRIEIAEESLAELQSKLHVCDSASYPLGCANAQAGVQVGLGIPQANLSHQPNKAATAPHQAQTQDRELKRTAPIAGPLWVPLATTRQSFSAHIPISAADACGGGARHETTPLQPLEIIRGAKAFMAAAAAQAGVAVEDVCWWFQSGYEVAEGGDRLAWSTRLHSATSAAAFMACFILNATECTLINAVREFAEGFAATGSHAHAQGASSGSEGAAQPAPRGTRMTVASDEDICPADSGASRLYPAAASQRSTPSASAGHAAAASCMNSMHEPGSQEPAYIRPRLSCGVGRSCDAEAAAAGMLRRLVRRYEGLLPRWRMCRVLRDVVAMIQCFAASVSADTMQEQYPPAVHITEHAGQTSCRTQGEVGVEGDTDVVATGSVPSDPIACVIRTLVATALRIQAELERQTTPASARRVVDLQALKAQARGRVVEGAVNQLLLQSHMTRHVQRQMLETRACMDGSMCQLEDRNVAVCSLLDASPAQAAAAEELWEEWRRRRSAEDGRLAAALRALAALPTPAAVPTAFLRHLSAVAEGAAAAGTQRSRGGNSGAQATCSWLSDTVADGQPLAGGVLGACARASGLAAEAVRGLLAASEEEKAGLAEFLGRVRMPSEAVGVWGMVAVCASTVERRAKCDMLRVLQLLAQQRQVQQLARAMAPLGAGPDGRCGPGGTSALGCVLPLASQCCDHPPIRVGTPSSMFRAAT